jgi:hypothetical protein
MGWHFWPYKKMLKTSCMVSIKEPKNWDLVVEYTKKDRSSFAKIRENRPDQNKVRNALSELLDNCKFVECAKNDGYIKALGMQP